MLPDKVPGGPNPHRSVQFRVRGSISASGLGGGGCPNPLLEMDRGGGQIRCDTRLDVISGQSLLLVLLFAPRDFLRVLKFFSLH